MHAIPKKRTHTFLATCLAVFVGLSFAGGYLFANQGGFTPIEPVIPIDGKKCPMSCTGSLCGAENCRCVANDPDDCETYTVS